MGMFALIFALILQTLKIGCQRKVFMYLGVWGVMSATSPHSGVRRKKFRGFKIMASLVVGPGRVAPGRPENSRKFAKNFLKKIAKMQTFRLFCKKFQNPALNFRAFGRKTQLLGKFWENFENFWWKCNRKRNSSIVVEIFC